MSQEDKDKTSRESSEEDSSSESDTSSEETQPHPQIIDNSRRILELHGIEKVRND